MSGCGFAVGPPCPVRDPVGTGDGLPPTWFPPVRYHTVIIGAGMSGLAAGIRLAYYEKPVCILERHTTIGGLNSFYRLRGRNYDVGLHAVTNYAPPGTRRGPLAKLLKQLRLRWDDFDLSRNVVPPSSSPGTESRSTTTSTGSATMSVTSSRSRRTGSGGLSPRLTPLTS